MSARGARNPWQAIPRRGAIAAAIVLAGGAAHAEPADARANHVRDVRVRAGGAAGTTEIEVVGTASPVYNVRVEAGGRRLLLDLANADVAGAPEALTEPIGVVGGVLTRAFRGGAGEVTRVAVSLSSRATYRVRPEGTTLRIVLSPEPPPGASPASPPPLSPANAKTGGHDDVEVRDVTFERAPATPRGPAKDRVVILTTATPSYALTTTPSGRVRLEMKGTRLPAAMKRTLDVTSYKGVLKTVSAFDDPATGAAIVEIDRASDAQGVVSLEGDKIVWSFDGPRAPSSPRGTVTVAREPSPAVQEIETSFRGGEDVAVEGGVAGFTSQVSAQAAGAGRFTGRRIEIDLKDADIHNILRLLADVGRVNIVTADDVQGNVTIRMRNVPWDQALDVVLQSKGLGMVRTGNLIRVAPLAQLQKERELRLAAAKQDLELAPLETRLIPVSYATGEEMQARAHDLLSPRGSLAVDDRTNTLIVRDVGGNIDRVEELVRSLDTQTSQVLIEARIVEATSRYLRDVGIQWGGDATFSDATGNPTGVAFPSRVGLAGGATDANTPTGGLSPFTRTVANPNFAVNLPAAVGTGQGGALGLTFGSIDNNFNLGVRLSAAESTGMLRIVSSPRILTLNNREARINQGTLIPFSQVSAQGVQTTFQEAKLQLLVKPHVTADGSVTMHVKINRDEPDFNQTSARGDPTILKREAETDLLVMDGHTAVIGGIYTRNTGRNLDQVPFFGDIPILGILFQRRRASDTRNELVIFLTPRIVNRSESLRR